MELQINNICSNEDEVKKIFSDAISYCTELLRRKKYYDDVENETMSRQSALLGQKFFEILQNARNELFAKGTKLNNKNSPISSLVNEKLKSQKLLNQHVVEILDSEDDNNVENSTTEVNNGGVGHDDDDVVQKTHVDAVAVNIAPLNQSLDKENEKNNTDDDNNTSNNISDDDYNCKNDEDDKDDNESDLDSSRGKKHRSIPYHMRVKIVELAEKHPHASVLQLRKLSGCNKIKKRQQVRDWAHQIEKGGSRNDMRKKINDWVYEKCIEYQNKNKRITCDLIRKWGFESKKINFKDNLPYEFCASPSWLRRFQIKYNITGHQLNLKINNKENNNKNPNNDKEKESTNKQIDSTDNIKDVASENFDSISKQHSTATKADNNLNNNINDIVDKPAENNLNNTLENSVDKNTDDVCTSSKNNTDDTVVQQVDKNSTGIINNQIKKNTTVIINNQIEKGSTGIINNRMEKNSTSIISNQVEKKSTGIVNDEVVKNLTAVVNEKIKETVNAMINQQDKENISTKNTNTNANYQDVHIAEKQDNIEHVNEKTNSEKDQAVIQRKITNENKKLPEQSNAIDVNVVIKTEPVDECQNETNELSSTMFKSPTATEYSLRKIKKEFVSSRSDGKRYSDRTILARKSISKMPKGIPINRTLSGIAHKKVPPGIPINRTPLGTAHKKMPPGIPINKTPLGIAINKTSPAISTNKIPVGVPVNRVPVGTPINTAVTKTPGESTIITSTDKKTPDVDPSNIRRTRSASKDLIANNSNIEVNQPIVNDNTPTIITAAATTTTTTTTTTTVTTTDVITTTADRITRSSVKRRISELLNNQENTPRKSARKNIVINEDIIIKSEKECESSPRKFSVDSKIFQISLDEKKRVVALANKLNLNEREDIDKLIKESQCKYLRSYEQLNSWRRHVKDGGTRNEKIKKISDWIYDRCVEYKKQNYTITQKIIKGWALEAKRVLSLKNLDDFHATDLWIHRFKRKYNLKLA